MDVPEAAHHQFVRLAVVRRFQGLVLFHRLGKGLGDLLLVAAALRLERQRIHRNRERHLRHRQRRRARRHRPPHPQVVDLRDADDVPRHRPGNRVRLLALDPQNLRNARLAPLIPDPGRPFRLERPAEHAQVRNLSDVRVAHDLEHLGAERPGGVARQDDLRGLFARALGRLAIGRLTRIRRILRQNVQQFLDAEFLRRARKQDRDESAGHERSREGLCQFLRRDRLLAEVPLHQSVVRLDDRLDGSAVRLGDVHQGFAFGLREGVHDALERRALPHRNRQEAAPRVEHLADLLDDALEVRVFRVRAVDDDHPRQPPLARRLKEPTRVDRHPRRRAHHHHGRVRRRHRRQRLPHEVRVPRRVEQVQVPVLPPEVQHAHQGARLAFFFLRLEVADRIAFLRSAQAGRHAGLVQHSLGELRFAGRRSPDEHHVANHFGLDLSHRFLPSAVRRRRNT